MPNGERYRLALIHRSGCPACRAYVVSLRGLAAVLPPVLLPWGLGAGALTRAHAGATLGAGAHPGAQAGAGVGGGAGTQAGVGIGGALSAPGAVGVGGAAGGSWLLAGGPFGAKLAVGCLIALGVGAGCAALTDGPHPPRAPVHRRDPAASATAAMGVGGAAGRSMTEHGLAPGAPGTGPASARGRSISTLTPTERAVREFGPERGPGALVPGPVSSADRHAPVGRSASSSSEPTSAVAVGSSAGGATSGGRSSTTPVQPARPASAPAAGASAAAREFGIG